LEKDKSRKGDSSQRKRTKDTNTQRTGEDYASCWGSQLTRVLWDHEWAVTGNRKLEEFSSEPLQQATKSITSFSTCLAWKSGFWPQKAEVGYKVTLGDSKGQRCLEQKTKYSKLFQDKKTKVSLSGRPVAMAQICRGAMKSSLPYSI
jgi:hypothetical protein